ncbi:putative N-acetyltransferase camello [Lissotriton helveticus]
MAPCLVRRYKDEDYTAVRELLTHNINGLIPLQLKYSLTLLWVKVLFLVAPLTLFLVFKSILLSVTALAMCFTFVWYGSRYVFKWYLYNYLDGDMKDIQSSYMQKKGACFWVAECDGEVAGFVAADSAGEKEVGLFRMNVGEKFRGRGIGKALCQTVMNFAREEGYEAVVLDTSTVQVPAKILYQKMGFKRHYSYVPPYFLFKVMRFTMTRFRYEILRRG